MYCMYFSIAEKQTQHSEKGIVIISQNYNLCSYFACSIKMQNMATGLAACKKNYFEEYLALFFMRGSKFFMKCLQIHNFRRRSTNVTSKYNYDQQKQ